MDESDLTARAQQGDGAAWEHVVRQHQDAVFRLAYLLLGDADEAEDVAQETFIRAFDALDRFDLSRPLRPWLLRIATNLAHNRRRAIGRYLAAARRMFQAAPESAPGIEGQSARRWESQILWQAVRRLSVADQQVIYLRYFLDQSEAEMASTLNIASGTVKSRLHRAINRLRAVVEREFPGLREVRDV
ncbi:MAG TPA: sigma-70 family RNA polymerase sigma factor [Herpetosiphonaceae bacterium]